jgi:hypothetical protein
VRGADWREREAGHVGFVEAGERLEERRLVVHQAVTVSKRKRVLLEGDIQQVPTVIDVPGCVDHQQEPFERRRNSRIGEQHEMVDPLVVHRSTLGTEQEIFHPICTDPARRITRAHVVAPWREPVRDHLIAQRGQFGKRCRNGVALRRERSRHVPHEALHRSGGWDAKYSPTHSDHINEVIPERANQGTSRDPLCEIDKGVVVVKVVEHPRLRSDRYVGRIASEDLRPQFPYPVVGLVLDGDGAACPCLEFGDESDTFAAVRRVRRENPNGVARRCSRTMSHSPKQQSKNNNENREPAHGSPFPATPRTANTTAGMPPAYPPCPTRTPDGSPGDIVS